MIFIVRCTCDSSTTIVLTRFDRMIFIGLSCAMLAGSLQDSRTIIIRQSCDSRALSQKFNMDRATCLLPTYLCRRSVYNFNRRDQITRTIGCKLGNSLGRTQRTSEERECQAKDLKHSKNANSSMFSTPCSIQKKLTPPCPVHVEAFKKHKYLHV